MLAVISAHVRQLRAWIAAESLWRRPFLRNVAVVAGGTATAQAITVAFSPIITRLYGPEAFGILGVFVSVISIVSPIASLCYVHAIVLPPRDEDGLRILRASVMIAVGMAAVVAAIILPLRHQLAVALGLQAVAPYLLLVPVVLFLAALAQAYDQWLIRAKRFRTSSAITITQTLAVSGAKAGVGLVSPSAAALVGIAAAGHGLHALLSALGAHATVRQAVDAGPRPGLLDARTSALVREYRDFPLYRAPQVFLNSISRNLPVILLASLFGPAAAGLYAIGQRVLSLPAAIVSQSVGKVFLQRIAEAAHKGEDLQRLIVRATLGLAAVGVLPFALIIAFGPGLFGFIFGSEWVTAGEYGRWLALWLFFMFVNVPSVSAIPLLALQGQLLLYETLVVFSRVACIVIGALLLRSDICAVALFSVVGALVNILLVVWVAYQSRHGPRSLSNSASTFGSTGEA